MKAYVSGPMYGRPNLNVASFNEAARLVTLAGVDPLTPHEIVPEHVGPCVKDPLSGADGHTWACHLHADLKAMLECDAVVMLPGWERSHGARLEQTVAASCSIPIFYLDGSELGFPRTSMGEALRFESYTGEGR